MFDQELPRTTTSAAVMPTVSVGVALVDNGREPGTAELEGSIANIRGRAARDSRLKEMRKSTTTLNKAVFDLHWRYVVKGWLLRGEVSMVYGPSNVGKSTFVVDLVRSVATGAHWHGRLTRGGPVVYVAAESAVSVVERAHGLLGESAHKVALLAMRPDLLDVIDVDAIIELVRLQGEECGEQVAMVVFDTLTLCIGAGDENSNADAVRVAAAAQRIALETGAHVMLVHHSGKDRAAGPRGASGLVGNADTVIELVAIESETDRYVLAHAVKQRRMSRLRPFAFHIRAVVLGKDEDGEDRTTSRLEAHEDQSAAASRVGAKPAGDATAREVAVIEALGDLAKVGDNSVGFTRTAIAGACAGLPIFRGLARESLLKAVARALDGACGRPGATIEAVSPDRHRLARC